MGVVMGEPRGTHVPVLLERCLELLAPALGRPGAVHVDFTLGLGGHAEAVLERFPDVVLIGLDRDTEALAHARHRLSRFADRTHLVHAIYHELPRVLDELGIPAIDSGLFDLGVSSLQLDEADRGFAYAQDAPLDMRMDQSRGATAEEVVNGYEPGELVRILRQYGEEKFATRIVSTIVRERAKNRITSTARLADLVKDSIPAAARRTGGNPAKRTFQALRIEVNGELDSVESAVPAALDALAINGRLVVMSYQSLEDRIVKRAFTARVRSTGPVDLPVELPGTGPSMRLLTRGSEPPTEAEVAENPRAASVKLRAVERIDEREQGRKYDRAPMAGRERPRVSTGGGQGRLRPGAKQEGEGRS
ncbi:MULTISPECIES: 16S rRNA (cytosine(1402)-N(4))-methyltransferase RsmH [Actinoplanes]|uniref:16S rRNA (cytosine(1402)-N(4))-methyltransferase RsmH n=1 Tax=Actinoplanes TaxID=1865 RepID=UPI0005F2F461|nr:MULTISPECIES: 16S rRNA (cytosine(1402)-N(4))-methyltransferase RsmH [Actinoplanes]GLY01883.1 ribosomal RNA small subunit methyltransferase H [Actinoplanes sp. NBRC 101535]